MDHLAAAEHESNDSSPASASRPPSRHSRSNSKAVEGSSVSAPEVLDVSPPGPSDVELDQACLDHIQAIIEQSITNVGLNDREYEVRLVDA